jgi:hypothetical protein
MAIQPALDAIFVRLGRISERISELEANTPMMTVLEQFYEKRKNVAIDREVDKKLRDVLMTAASRLSPPDDAPKVVK